MTEFELASLANETQNTSIGLLTTYFSLVSGFLVVAFLAAHRLTRTMVAGIVGLFVIWSFGFISVNLTVARNYYGLLAEIRELAHAGKGFEWHAFQIAPDWLLQLRPYGSTIAAVIVAVGAVYFFFHCRKHNRIASA